MENFRRKILAVIRTHSLFRAGDTVVVGVSGGIDSIALLDVLVSLSSEIPVSLVVGHLNHLLRGEDSDGDEAFVRAVAAASNVPVVTCRVDIQDLARQRSLSLEEAGRTARYSFFSDLAAEVGATAVAVAHHADDQAETLLMRLLRGAGTDGLAAMRVRNEKGVVRPFLFATRDEIEAYAVARGLHYRSDVSNGDCTFLRNRLRHQLLPLLKTYNPEIVRTLASTADVLAADGEVLDRVVDAAFGRLCSVAEEQVDFDRAALAVELQGVRLRLYRRAIARVSGTLRRIGRLHLLDIDNLFLRGEPGATVSLPGNIFARCSYSTASILLLSEVTSDLSEVEVSAPGDVSLPSGVLRISSSVSLPASYGNGVEFFDADALPFPWRVRYFRNGDRFTPFGRSTPIKLKDFFINNKIPCHERRRIPLLVDAEDRIFAICGIRRSCLGLIKSGTSRVVSVEVVRKPADLLV